MKKIAVYLHCDRSWDTTRDDRLQEDRVRRRNTSTRSTECPFRAVLRLQRVDDTWKLEVQNPDHNHGSTHMSTHPTLRRRVIKQFDEEIRWELRNGLKRSEVLALLQPTYPFIRPKDISNVINQIKFDLLAGRPSIQALLEELPKYGDWLFRYELNDDNSLKTLFGMHRTSIAMLRTNHWVLWMDCTYKTNRFRMPLLNIVGAASSGQTFHAAFAFLSNEKEESISFALECLQELYQKEGLTAPKTIFTDKDNASLNAIKRIFPHTASMLCLWHINKAIRKHGRPLILRQVRALVNSGQLTTEEAASEITKRWNKMLQRWIRVVYAESLIETQERWRQFKWQYSEPLFEDFLCYIDSYWLNEETSQRFLHCFTSKYLHLGEVSTSRNESAHWALKRGLRSSTCDLLAALLSFEVTIVRQFEEIQAVVTNQLLKRQLSAPSLVQAGILKDVSKYAIEKVMKLFKRFLPPGPDKPRVPETPCECDSVNTSGFPCIHLIHEYWRDGKSFTAAHFHSHYRLRESSTTPGFNDLALIGQPRVVLQNRGGQRAEGTSTRRLASAFEVADQQENAALARMARESRAATQETVSTQDTVTAQVEDIAEARAITGNSRGRGAKRGQSQGRGGRRGGGASRGRGRGRGAQRGRGRGRASVADTLSSDDILAGI